MSDAPHEHRGPHMGYSPPYCTCGCQMTLQHDTMRWDQGGTAAPRLHHVNAQGQPVDRWSCVWEQCPDRGRVVEVPVVLLQFKEPT